MEPQEPSLKRHTSFFFNKWMIVVVILCAIGLSFIALYLTIISSQLNLKNITDDSVVKSTKDIVYYNVYSKKGYIYKSSKTGIDAAWDFISSKRESNGAILIPDNFDKNVLVIRSKLDKDMPTEHYYFAQSINQIPVFGSTIVVHIRNSNEIYSLTGTVILNELLDSPILSEDQTKQIALEKAKKDAGSQVQLVVKESKPYVFNKTVLGESSDSKNYNTYGITVEQNSLIKSFATMYFVDRVSGEIVYQETLILDVNQREVYDCSSANIGNNNQCPIKRQEGSNPSGDKDADNAYTFLGLTYDYYKNSFQRDSFDNKGSRLKALVNISDPINTPEPMCPNAFWYGGTDNQLVICKGLAVRDVVGHELTHGVTEYTANLTYVFQSGTLNESISDVFGSAIDNNWTVGEDDLGIIRRMDDPPQKNQADRLFSPLYYCSPAGEECKKENDQCGVHYNNGIVNKAFYLMVEGGNFNGCTISGVGRQKAHAVVYRALTTYLSRTSNFKSFYSAVLSACNDLYNNDGTTCDQIKAAMQSTEIDQQPDNDQTGALCSGKKAQEPACAQINNPSPTVKPTIRVTNSPTPIISSPSPIISLPVGTCNVTLASVDESNTGYNLVKLNFSGRGGSEVILQMGQKGSAGKESGNAYNLNGFFSQNLVQALSPADKGKLSNQPPNEYGALGQFTSDVVYVNDVPADFKIYEWEKRFKKNPSVLNTSSNPSDFVTGKSVAWWYFLDYCDGKATTCTHNNITVKLPKGVSTYFFCSVRKQSPSIDLVCNGNPVCSYNDGPDISTPTKACNAWIQSCSTSDFAKYEPGIAGGGTQRGSGGINVDTFLTP